MEKKEKKSEIKLREYKQPQTLRDILDHTKWYSRYAIENSWWYEIWGFAITRRDVEVYRKIRDLISQWKIIEPVNSVYSTLNYPED
jgi:hypothetical protein